MIVYSVNIYSVSSGLQNQHLREEKEQFTLSHVMISVFLWTKTSLQWSHSISILKSPFDVLSPSDTVTDGYSTNTQSSNPYAFILSYISETSKTKCKKLQSVLHQQEL